MPAKELPVLTYKELNERQWHCNITQNPWPPRYTPAQLEKGSWVILVEALFSLLFTLSFRKMVFWWPRWKIPRTTHFFLNFPLPTKQEKTQFSSHFTLLPPPPGLCLSTPQLSSQPKTAFEFNFSSPDKHNIVLLWKQF